jgi:hemolysin activation/secretion protein
MEIRIKDYQPIHLALDYNNFGSKLVSRDRFGIGVEMGNLLADGHLLSLRSVLGSPLKNMTSTKGDYTAPLGYRGHTLHFSYMRGDFDVGRAFEKLDIQMKSESMDISLSYPFVKERFSGFSGEVGLVRNNFTQSALGQITSQDKIRVLRGGLDYYKAADVTRDFLSFRLFQGLGTFMGGMGRESPSPSRQAADNQFTKGTVDWVRVRAVPEPYWMYHPFSLIFAGGIQWSSDNLVVGEQFPLGGPDSVRGYPSGEFLGDHGYRMSSELRVSPFPNTEKIQGAFFVDHSGGFIKKRLGADMEEHYLTGMGLGVRFNFPGSVHLREPGPEIPGYIIDYQFQIRADMGYPLYPRPSSSGKSPVYAIQAIGRF